MGLDMYLDKELYVSEYSKADKEILPKIYSLLNVKDESKNYAHATISIPAIYWRKSNQIHSWFVSNVQDGEDDCKSYRVDEDDLKKLLGVIKAQLKDKDKIILNPQEGFFFGSTEIDDWYWQDLEFTKKELVRELKFLTEQAKLGRNWYYEYRASW